MIEIYSESRGKEGFYKVYENYEEFEATGLVASESFNEIEVGQYFKTRNGYYIPLVDKREYRDGRLYRFTFPRALFLAARNKKGEIITARVVYDPRHRIKNKIKDGDIALFLQFLFAGLTPTRAWALVTVSRKNSAIHNINSYFDMLTSDKLHKHIKDIMKSDLKQGLTANNMDAAWYAKTLKDLIEDPKAHKDVKLKALDEVKLILDADNIPKSETAIEKMESLRKDVLKKYEVSPKTGTDQ